MKKAAQFAFYFTFSLLLMAFQCDEEDSDFSCENTMSYLSELKIEIEDLADSSICSENFECRYMPFGKKPCGGPWSYLIYSASIDTIRLMDLVENYNMNEEEFNENCGAVSDCMVISPPIAIACECFWISGS